MKRKKVIVRGALFGAMVMMFWMVSATKADVRLSGLFSDNMVLQQGMQAPIWGWADDGEKVTVTFRGQTAKTVARGGKWMVRLDALKAGGPDTLIIRGKNSIEIKNVLVGEVWLCSGQSNMEWPLGACFEPKADVESATNPQIRLLLVPRVKADKPVDSIQATWQKCEPNTAAAFSGVGYYFGRDLQKALGVPVGLIEADMSGSPAQAWIKHAVFEASPDYRHDVLDFYDFEENRHRELSAKFEMEKAQAAQRGISFREEPPYVPWQPSALYNAMLRPLIPYSMKGVAWYQGEANAGSVKLYRTLLADLIRTWRQEWGEGNFPFLIVELAPFGGTTDQPYRRSVYAEGREVQFKTVKSVPGTALIVTTDVGEIENIHPTKKQPVGARLALAARGIAYGEPIEYSGPFYRSMEVRQGKAIINFDHASSGLEARGGDLKEFAICGPDHIFVWGRAEIDAASGNSTVIVSSPLVSEPVAVRFGWVNTPDVNLWNKEGLPASPFRTDDFPLMDAYYKEIAGRVQAKFGTNGVPKDRTGRD